MDLLIVGIILILSYMSCGIGCIVGIMLAFKSKKVEIPYTSMSDALLNGVFWPIIVYKLITSIKDNKDKDDDNG